MPYIEVKNAGSLTEKQVNQIIEEITNSISTITGKPKESTYVVVQEVTGVLEAFPLK